MEALVDVQNGWTRFLEESVDVDEGSNSTLSRSKNSAIIGTTFRFWGSIYLVVFVVFCLVRHYFPKYFSVRSWVPELECEIAKKADYNFINWFWKVFNVSDDELLEACGMDAVCFIRALSFGRRLSYVGCLNALWLIPLYMTAPTSPTTYDLTDPLEVTSFANLPEGSPRFLGTVLASYITFGYSMYLVFLEFKWFTDCRHKFLGLRKPRNYAIYVSGIPEGLACSHELKQYFSQNAEVLEAHIAMNIPELEAKVARRDVVVEQLEHTIALEKNSGSKQTHHKIDRSGRIEKVQTVTALQAELAQLNKAITRESNVVFHTLDPKRRNLKRFAAKHINFSLADDVYNIDDEDARNNSRNSQSFRAILGSLSSLNSSNHNRTRLDSASSAHRTRAESTGSARDRLESTGSLRKRSRRRATSSGGRDRTDSIPCDQVDEELLSILRSKGTTETNIISEVPETEDAPQTTSSGRENDVDLQPIFEMDSFDDISVDFRESRMDRIGEILERGHNYSTSTSQQLHDWDERDPLSNDPDLERGRSVTEDTIKLSELMTGSPEGTLRLSELITGSFHEVKKPTQTSEQNDLNDTTVDNPPSLDEKVRPPVDSSVDQISSMDISLIESQADNSAPELKHGCADNEGGNKSNDIEIIQIQSFDETIYHDTVEKSNSPAKAKAEHSRFYSPRLPGDHNDNQLFHRSKSLAFISGRNTQPPDKPEHNASSSNFFSTRMGLPSSDTQSSNLSSNPSASSLPSEKQEKAPRRHSLFGAMVPSGERLTRQSSKSFVPIASAVLAVTTATRNSSQLAATAVSTATSATFDAGKSVAKAVVSTGEVIKHIAKDAKVDKMISEAGQKGYKLTSHVVTSAGTVLPMLVQVQSGVARSAGFVVFKSLYATQMSLQMLQHPRPHTMQVQEAPDPKDIFWRNVGMPHNARRTGRLLSVSASATLCFFWSIPTATIASLADVNSLKVSLPWLGALIERQPWVETFVAMLAPFLLLVINETFLPSILKYFATWEGHVSSAVLEASLFVKMSSFMIIQTFFVSLITGGITSEITNVIEDPGSLVTLLSNTLPGMSVYFIQIILTSTFFLQSLELMRAYPLGMAMLRKFVGPNLTEKERARKWRFKEFLEINSLEEPPDFWLAETKAQLLLFYLVFFVYSSIAPLTSYFLLLCFPLMEAGYRYQLIHNYPPSFETGGNLWSQFIRFTMSSMLIAEVTLVGLMVLKQSTYSTPFVAPLIAVTVIFFIYLETEISRVAQNLPTRDCVVLDARNEGMDFDFVKDEYLQPALQPKSRKSVEVILEERE